MANLTSVGVTSGVPSSGTGTVSTLDQLLAAGSPISNGSSSLLVSVKAALTPATSADVALVVALSPNNPVTLSGTLTSLSSGAVSIINGANTAAVKASATAPSSTDPALVVAISPNSVNANGQATMANSSPVVFASNQSFIPVAGDVANGSSAWGNPVGIAGVFNSSNPTAVSSNQRVNLWADKSGKLIINSALRTLKGVTLTSFSSTTTETNITPSSSGGLFLDLYGLIVANETANVQSVTIKDSSGGTTRTELQVPANDTRGFMLPADAALPQAASSQAWTATLSNSSGVVKITALYVTNA